MPGDFSPHSEGEWDGEAGEMALWDGGGLPACSLMGALAIGEGSGFTEKKGEQNRQEVEAPSLGESRLSGRLEGRPRWSVE